MLLEEVVAKITKFLEPRGASSKTPVTLRTHMDNHPDYVANGKPVSIRVTACGKVQSPEKIKFNDLSWDHPELSGFGLNRGTKELFRVEVEFSTPDGSFWVNMADYLGIGNFYWSKNYSTDISGYNRNSSCCAGCNAPIKSPAIVCFECRDSIPDTKDLQIGWQINLAAQFEESLDASDAEIEEFRIIQEKVKETISSFSPSEEGLKRLSQFESADEIWAWVKILARTPVNKEPQEKPTVVRWVNLYGSLQRCTTPKLAKRFADFEKSPNRPVSAEAYTAGKRKVEKAKFGLLVDTARTELLACTSEDAFTPTSRLDKISPCFYKTSKTKYGSLVPVAFEWEQIENLPVTKSQGSLGCREAVIVNPVYTAVVVVKGKNSKRKLAEEFAKEMGLPLVEID